jgi:hypothetical protein
MRWAVAAFKVCGTMAIGTTLRQAATSFQLGMAARVAERLKTMHTEREAAVAA